MRIAENELPAIVVKAIDLASEDKERLGATERTDGE
jgi:hypothetical protein